MVSFGLKRTAPASDVMQFALALYRSYITVQLISAQLCIMRHDDLAMADYAMRQPVNCQSHHVVDSGKQ